ncbi:MAG: 4Fe-4S dicluster domain-containing protein [Halanaerobium sp.]|nr:4Fe-4S dicluster domain-containing protein [Halanaerobium sp.]
MAKNKVVFDEERCKGCELCTRGPKIVCPVDIIKMSDRFNEKGYRVAEVTDMDKCIACGNCAITCPDVVITVYKDVDE